MRGRIAGRVTDRVVRRLLHELGAGEDAAGHLAACAADAGVVVEEVLRERPEWGVAVAASAVHGRCVLKTVPDAQHPDRALAQLARARLQQEHVLPLFPRVLACSSAWVLEEHVPGLSLRRWLQQEPDMVEVTTLLTQLTADLRALPPVSALGLQEGPLRPADLHALTSALLRKCLRQARYAKGLHRAAVEAVRLPALQHRVVRVRQLATALSVAAPLSRTLAVGDAGAVNWRVSGAGPDLRAVDIDYETLGAGHWGLDVAYLSASLLRYDVPDEHRRLLLALALDEPHLPRAGAAFFAALADLLSHAVAAAFGRPEPADLAGTLDRPALTARSAAE